MVAKLDETTLSMQYIYIANNTNPVVKELETEIFGLKKALGQVQTALVTTNIISLESTKKFR